MESFRSQWAEIACVMKPLILRTNTKRSSYGKANAPGHSV